MQKVKNFILAHPELFTVLSLLLIYYVIFFYGIGNYALMDVDESRYVLMSKDMFHSKDFMTLYLNGAYFFEKPPLYFWGECLSFAIFGQVSEWTARFPVALYGSLTCLTTYVLGRKIVSRGFGVVSSLILATSIEFVILAKFAILDILVAACIWFSLCSGIMIYFCKEQNKKYFWWLFYIFSGLAVMAKGVPGFVVPFGSMFFISIYFKKFKEIFKPQYFFIGLILFLLIVLPWHIAMLKMYYPLFFNEYIIKHHIARFLGSEVINREQPFYFYFLTLLWGFLPWTISCVFVLVRKIWKRDFRFREVGNVQKFLMCNGIIAIFTLLFFSISGTKLITYILPIYPSLSILGGYIWFNYIERGEYSRIIDRTVYITSGIFIFAGFLAIFTKFFLPEELNSDISVVKPLSIVLLIFFGLCSIISVKKGKYLLVFLSYVLFMAFLSAYGTGKLFKVDYKFGQDDLIEFAKYSKEQDKPIATYNVFQKYSLIYYSDKKVNFGYNHKPSDVAQQLDDGYLVVLKKKNLKDLHNINYKLIKEGKKYLLIEKK